MADYPRRWDGAPRYDPGPPMGPYGMERPGYPGPPLEPPRQGARPEFNTFDRGAPQRRSPSPPYRRELGRRSPFRQQRELSPFSMKLQGRRPSPPMAGRPMDRFGAPEPYSRIPGSRSPPPIGYDTGLKRPRSPSPQIRRDVPPNYRPASPTYRRPPSPKDRFRSHSPLRRPPSPGAWPPRREDLLGRPPSPGAWPPRREDPIGRPPSPGGWPPRREDPIGRPPSPGGWPPRREEFPKRPTSSGMMSSVPMQAQSIKNMTGTIKEFVNSFSGIIELSQAEGDVSIPPTAFFHASAVWVVNRAGNPYGPPVKYLDVLGPNVSPSANGINLEKEMPIGSKVCLTIKMLDVRNYVNSVAITVWPTTTEPPPREQLDSQSVLMEKKQDHYLKEFINALEDAKANESLVQATFPIFPWQGSGLGSRATVLQIKDHNYGILQLTGSSQTGENYKFFSLFHRDQVWLKDGKRGRDVDFFKDKPLESMVQEGQDVKVSARSIMMTSGAQLQPSILELQAIVVCVGEMPQSAFKPTMCFGGTGAYGMGAQASWYYFNQDLHNDMNRQLVTYLKTYNKYYSDLNPVCLQVTEPKKNNAEARGTLPHKLTNAVAQVREHFNSCLIVENYDRTWRCLVTMSRIISARGQIDLELNFPLASTLHFNAVLVNENKPIQYVATVAWSKHDVQPTLAEIANRERGMDHETNNLYRFCNEKNAIPKTEPSGASQRPNGLRPYYEFQEATVSKILDDYFGVLVFDGKLALFDTCDVEIRPNETLDSLGKKLNDVLRVGTVVYFNGNLIDEKEYVQYLASFVCLKKDHNLFVGKIPRCMPNVADIPKTKIDIYKQVIHTASNIINPGNPSAPISNRQTLNIVHSKEGTIKCLFFDTNYPEYQHIVGGVIYNTKEDFAFFLSKHNLVVSMMPAIGMKVKYNARPCDSKNQSGIKIPFLAISIFQHGNVTEIPSEAEQKYNESYQKLTQMLEGPLVSGAFLPLIEGKSPGFIDITPSKGVSFPTVGLKIHDEVPYSSIKCMIDETSGILESNFDSKSLCYFEIEDLNVELPVDVKDLVMIMNKMEGIRVRYQAKMMDDKGYVQYVAHTKGVQIIGILPDYMSHIKLGDQDYKSDQPVGHRSEKMGRYRKAEEAFKKGKYLNLAKILDGSYKKKPDHVKKLGVVKYILNESFGLIYGPSDAESEDDKEFSLFDTYDLQVTDKANAADLNKPIESVTPIDTEVFYNACFIDGTTPIHYLATSVWAANNSQISSPLEPYAEGEILKAKDKIEVYKQVADSCHAVVASVRKSILRQKVNGGGASIRMRKEQIDKVYQTDVYKAYIKETPKHKRSPRDPVTPDRNLPMNPGEWTNKMVNWQNELGKLGKKNSNNALGTSDLTDFKMTGTVCREMNSKYAIVQLANNTKALLHRDRVWINDRPLYGDWNLLKKPFHKVLNVNARRWKGPMDIDYQVTFCHLGLANKDPNTKFFVYPNAMKFWISNINQNQKLEAELTEFQNLLKN